MINGALAGQSFVSSLPPSLSAPTKGRTLDHIGFEITNLEAFCYSNVSGFRDGNYRIDTSPEALAAFQALASDPYFN